MKREEFNGQESKIKSFFSNIKIKIKNVFNKVKSKLKDSVSYSKTNVKQFKLDKTTIKKIVICIFLVIALVIQISFLSYLVKGILPDTEKDKKNALMSYTSSGRLDYRVYLKPNDFISAPYLEAGEAYILNLIDYVKVNTNYNFNASSKTKVNGNNKLMAKLKVYYKESTNKETNPEVMKKERVLTQRVINFEDLGYNLNNEYKLYLNDYLKILKDFQDQIKISVEGYLEVSSETTLNGEVGGIKYNSSYSNTMKIPLSGSVINIENESPEDKTGYVYESELVKSNKKVMSFIIIANILDFAVICFLLKKLFQFTNKTEYERTLSKILKTYDEIIVNTTNILDIDKYSIIEIPEFKEILNLSRELLLPIMNYEVVKGKETWFYVIKDNILYRFTVKEKDFLKKGIKLIKEENGNVNEENSKNDNKINDK